MDETNRLYVGELPDSPLRIRIGPFELLDPVGQGSMGEVWRSRHLDQDVEVAVKVVLTEHATERRFQRAFRQEARSMAELFHPFIVDIHDYGALGEDTEQSSMGRFRVGSPFLVMDFACYGSLAGELNEPLDWQVTHLILVALLDALAHSHARGVLHRDIKPRNVLLTEPGDKLGVELTDFGLAYALRAPQELAEWHRAAGTPEYMSPEQLTSEWRKYGPATDLYGVGCLAWKMLTGTPPFSGDNLGQIAHSHIQDPPPDLPGDLDVPDQLEKWLHTLLAKQPGDRFDTAAEAVRTLHQIAGPIDDSALPSRWARTFRPSHSEEELEHTLLPSIQPSHTLEAILDDVSPPRSDTAAASPAGIDQRLHDYGDVQPPLDPAVRMAGTGAGIYRFRRFPLVGRHDERQHLWERLGDTIEHRQPGISVLTGPAGIGKDALAQWLGERGHELGAIELLHVRHGTRDESPGGFVEMLKREFALQGLTPHEVEQFFESLLTGLGAEDPYEWEALTELLHPGSSGDAGPGIHFSDPTQRYVVIQRLLARLASRKPVFLWISDAHRRLETLETVRLFAEQSLQDFPVYVTMTVREDELTDPHRREALDAILDTPLADRLEIGPLDDESTQQLVANALFLEPTTAYEVMRRSGGNPLYALELVGSWIDRELLRAGRRGYALRDDADPAPVGDWIEMWADVVDRLVDDDPDARPVLELAAILGRQFPRDAWQRAADIADLSIPEALIDRLVDRRYLEPTGDHFRFTQNMVQEALHTSARNHNRWQQFCRLCVEALDEVSDDDSHPERTPYLLAEAGEHLESARRFLAVARRRRDHRDYPAMTYLAQRGLEAVDELPESEQTLRLAVELHTVLSHGWHGLNKNEPALEAAKRGYKCAERLGAPDWCGALVGRKAGPLNVLGRLDEARDAAEQALELLEDRDEFAERRTSACIMLSHIAIRRREFDRARRRLEQARQLSDQISDDPVRSAELEHLGLKIALQRGDDVPADQLENLYRRSERLRLVPGMTTAANKRGELARQNGDFDEAHQWYEKAIAAARLFNLGAATAPRLNLALMTVEHGNFRAAGLRAERVLQDLRRMSRPVMKLYAWAIKLPMHAARGDHKALQENLTNVEETLEKLQIGNDSDLALCFRSARDELQGDEKSQQALRRRLQDLLAETEES